MKGRRLSFLMFSIALLAAASAELARAQVQIQPPTLTLSGTAHHVKGVAVKGNCSMALSGINLTVKEYWYSTSSRNLTPVADPITFNGNTLVQGKALGSVVPDATGNFDVTWTEVATAARVPWALNVTNTRTGARLTVYRLLWLEASANVPNVFGSLKDSPLIQFFNTETTKNVGTVTVNCTPFG